MASVHGIDFACNGSRKRPNSKVVVVKEATVPEAACSVNGYFKLDGYPERFQATGRGLTPAEAAANLRGTIEATRAALAPVPNEPPVRSKPTRLSILLACWLEKAWDHGEDAMGDRIIKAAHLIRNGAVYVGNREGLMTVRSQRNPETWYDVENGQCTCKDWTAHVQAGKKAHCKHTFAVQMYLRLAEPQ